MSRRKQLKPRCHNNNEHSFLESSEPPATSITDDTNGVGLENEIGAANDHYDFDTTSPSYVPLSPAARDCDSSVSPTSDDLQIQEDSSKPNGTGNFHWCAFCSATFDQIVALKAHEQTHCNLMAYRCTHCERGFRHKRSLDRHLKLHIGTKNFQCDTCGSAFFRADHLKLHVKTHSAAKINPTCAECNAEMTSAESIEDHKQNCPSRAVRNGTGSKTEYICNTCGQVIAGEVELKRHQVGHTSEPLDDAASPLATWDSDSNLTSTPQSNRPGSPPLTTSGQTICGNCPKVFRDIRELLQHMPFCTGSGSQTCPICGQNGFQSEENLYAHMDTCHNESEILFRPRSNQSGKGHSDSKLGISCSLCTKRFGDVDSLQKHTLQQHSMREIDSNADPRYPCEHCEKTFDSILALHGHANVRHNGIVTSSGRASNRHLNVGAKPDVYMCSQCHVALPDLKAFTKHMAMEHMETKRPPPTFLCEQCGLAFTSEAVLDAHLVRHFLQKESQYGCKSCGKSFASPDELQKHLLELHAAHLYRCSLCKEVFESRVDIQVHFAVAHSNETVSYRCRTCNAVFDSEQQFNVHLQAVHLRRPLNCLQKFVCCEKTFSNEKEFNDHCATHKPFTCKLCGEAFVVEYLLERHVESAHSYGTDGGDVSNGSRRRSFNGNGYNSDSIGDCENIANSLNFPTPSGNPGLVKCNICDRKCESVRELADHKLQHCKVLHSDTCSVCRASVNSLELFYTHTRQHNAQGIPVACVICRQSLVSSVELQAHAKFHLRLSDMSSCCQVCSKPTELSGALICHDCESNCGRKVDENSQPRKCPECRVKFESTEELKEHRRVAHVKPYECIKCQKSFATEEEIHSHVATHVMEDGVFHQCALCVQYFDSPSKLQCHLIEHSFAGCQEFQCYLCNLVFSLAPPLMQHMQKAHNFEERPYDCPNVDCQQKFFFRAELDNHMLTVHLTPLGTTSSAQEKVESSRDGSKMKRISSAASMSNFASFPCPNCTKVFSSLSALQGHSHVHMTSRVHRCAKCDKEFVTAAKLRNHQRQHNGGERPHDCYICRRQFSRKDNLKAHMQIHYRLVNGVTERIEDSQQSSGRDELEFGELRENSVDFSNSKGSDSLLICFDDNADGGDSSEQTEESRKASADEQMDLSPSDLP